MLSKHPWEKKVLELFVGYFEVKGLRSRKYGDVGGRKKEENGGEGVTMKIMRCI